MNQAMQSAISKLLGPLVRILLRYGVSYAEFAELAKQAYVKSAEFDFPLQNRKASVSRIAVLTGLNRKEVTRLRNKKNPTNAETSYNRGRRIISGWNRDSEFLDTQGEPKRLSLEGNGSFTELVKRYSGDMPVRAVLDELLRVNAIKYHSDPNSALGEIGGFYELANQAAYVPSADKDALFHYLGGAVKDLLVNLDHNLNRDPANEPSRLQLTTSYNNLSMASIEKFRSFGPAKARKFLKQIDNWLAKEDRDVLTVTDQAQNQEPKLDERLRAGFGVYYIEHVVEASL